MKLFILILALASFKLSAQQSPMYTHYMYNTLVVNPGYAGSRDALTITALHRSQWVNFDGAPMTQTLTMHSPLKNHPVGLGMSIFNDKIGPINNTSIVADFAYRMKLGVKSKLALGLSGGANIMQAQLSKLLLNQENDPTFQNNISNRATPTLGFGAYYSRERFYLGVSVPQLIENKLSSTTQLNGTNFLGKEQRHYFLIAGAVFNLSSNLAFKPTTLIKVTASAPIQADVTASFIIAKKLTVGAMYRTGDAVGALIGFDLTSQFHVGYAFDWSSGVRTSKYNQGSHELMIRYDFLSVSRKQIHSPRYF